jgi:hypothetical protein
MFVHFANMVFEIWLLTLESLYLAGGNYYGKSRRRRRRRT